MKKKILISAIILFILVLSAAAFFFLQNQSSEDNKNPFQEISEIIESDSEAVKAGKQLSGGKCSGEGPVKLGALPMDEKDFPYIEPYGLMIDAHVTPIDHWYFAPASRESAIDAYNVYAIADGTITEIQRRERINDKFGVKEEFRLVITYTCTFLSYYDLITVLDPAITDKATELNTSNNARVEIPVKEGQLIGKIGKQTLDFAVWDTEKPLSGFVVPEHYDREPWKIYTANPFDYFSDDIKKILLAKNLRTVDPIEGKIDFDIDGKLVGNWFTEGTNGYAGTNKTKYHEGHMAIVYNHLDPSAVMISIGDFNGKSEQMVVKGNKPDPAKVDKKTGLVKYELYNFQYLQPNGQPVEGDFIKNMKVKAGQELRGTVLFQLIEKRTLKMEVFPGKTAAQVTGFTSAARIYER